MNRKALSPLIATLLLVFFSLIIGVIAMNLGKWHMQEAEEITKPLESTIVLSIDILDDPLKSLQIDYMTDEISKEEYLAREKELIRKK